MNTNPTTTESYRALLQELQAKHDQDDPTRRIMEGAARALEREKNYSSFIDQTGTQTDTDTADQ